MSNLHQVKRSLLTRPAGTDNNETAVELWTRICELLSASIPEKAFRTWFSPIQPLHYHERELHVGIPTRFFFEWIEGHYASEVDHALLSTIGEGASLRYSIQAKHGDRPRSEPSAFPEASDAVLLAESDSEPAEQLQHAATAAGLNLRYTFDNFIEGPPNRFARAAAYAVARQPGKTAYNPLLLYGGVGLGKTHLLQAIGREALTQNPRLKVRFISSERFTQDFVEAIRNNRADEFSARWRSVDLLLLDDVQFLVGRDRTQMEFFHTFNTLHQSGKQIVLTSDKPPRELRGLDERLVSRMGWGLVCDIGPPDFETRLAIVMRFAAEENVDLDSDVAYYIASSIENNVRELQGAIVRLLAFSSLTASDITMQTAQHALQDLLRGRGSVKLVGVDTIQSLVAEHFDLSVDLLSARTRVQPVAKARMIAMALSVKMTGLSLKQVGNHFGGRDHTTVLHAKNKIDEWLATDSDFAQIFQQLEHAIRSRTL
ncbi:chromosomal replication initiator protein DnaA [bacterium]|nr:chromosomal replication initiator protein DnaA [bacterium]